MSEVVLKGLKKVYDNKVTAVHDVNLEIKDKEFIVLVGPSGCGKSTTLRMVAGLEEISDGELYIDGKLVNDVPPKDRDIAMVFQNYALYEIETTDEETIIEVTDTSDNNDVWNSKLLYFLGKILEKGKCYAAFFNLAGENGVGEFFFCKTDDLNNRYSFDDTPGDHVAKFAAEGEDLYAGLQFGNLGEGNDMTVTIGDIYQIPGVQKSSENCAETVSQDALTLTDTDDNNDVWNSKAVYDTGITLEPGKTYTATFTLTGENGVGEFFFLKSNDINNRYSFDNQAGEHTITFTAEDTALFFGIQCGNLGNGNSVTISNISVTPVEETGNRMMMAAAPQENEDEAAPEEGLAPAEEEAPAEEPVTQAPAENEEVETPAEEIETPAEEPAEEEIETPAEEPAEEEAPAEEPVTQAPAENEEVETPAEEPAAEEIETPAEEPAEEEAPAEEPAQEADGE